MTDSWFYREATKRAAAHGGNVTDHMVWLLSEYISRISKLGHLPPPEQVMTEGFALTLPRTPAPVQAKHESRMESQNKPSSRFTRCYQCGKPAIDRLPGGAPVCVYCRDQKPAKLR